MLGFDRILVPVDFSRDSMAALRYAVALAQNLCGQQTICVLYVADDRSALSTSRLGQGGAIEQAAELKKLGSKKIERFISDIDPGDQQIKHAVVVGNPTSRMICDYAAAHDFDLIVVGTTGKNAKASLRKWVLGSTSRYVQKMACCAVLSVKDPATSFKDAKPRDSRPPTP